MRKLERYIFFQTLRPLVMFTVCVTAVIWLTQVLQRVDVIVKDGGTLDAFVRVIILLTPNLLAILTPFTLFAATLFILNRLKSDSEVAVMTASGASMMRIATPFLVLAIIGTAFTYYMNVDLMPKSYREMKQTIRDVRDDIAQSLVRSGQFTKVADNLMIYAEEVRPGGQYLGVLIYDNRRENDPLTYMAESGLYRNSIYGPRLHLVRGNAQNVDPVTKEVEIIQFDETAIDLSPYQKINTDPDLEGTERYISELLHPDMSRPYDVQQAGVLIAEGHARLSTPLYNLFYVALALVAMLKAPFNRYGYGRRILAAVLIAVAVRVLGFVVENAASATAALNYVQYAIPALGTLITLLLLIGVPRMGLRERRKRSRLQAIEPSGAAA